MKFVAIALVALASVAAGLPVREQDYLAARDAYIARFTAEVEAGNFGDDVMAAHEEARDDLEFQLRSIIGPVTLQGVSSGGVISLDTLFDGDLGFGLLDGLLFDTPDVGARVLVTTEGLAGAWLVGHRDWWGEPAMPEDLREAVMVNGFHTQAISAGAAVARFAEIPVTPPAGADFAFAMLDMRSQDYAIGVPDEIIVAVVDKGRFYLANSSVRSPVVAIAACDAIWRDYEDRATAALAGAQESDPGDESDLDEFSRIYEEGEAAFHGCFAEQAEDQAFYPGLVAEAQALVDTLH